MKAVQNKTSNLFTITDNDGSAIASLPRFKQFIGRRIIEFEKGEYHD